MKLEHCINFIVTRAQHSVHQLFKTALASYGVTPGQYGVLRCLWDVNGQTGRQIADRLCLDASTMTGILDRMEQRGLILKETDPRDRRALQILLTPKGRDLQRPLEQAVQAANEQVLEALPTEEAEVLKKMLWDIGSIRSAQKG